MGAVQGSDTPASIVRAEKQTLITNVRQKLHSEESHKTKALISASCFYSPYATEQDLL